MPITFGSVGDIVATIQVAAKLLEILSSSRGSAREFQELVVELRTYHRALDNVLFLWLKRTQCPLLETLADIMLPVTRNCQNAITDFLDMIIKKYGSCLAQPGLKRDTKILGKMIQWHVFEGSRIRHLRDQLGKGIEIILIVQSQAQGISEERNQGLIFAKLQAITQLEEQVGVHLEKRFDDIAITVQRQNNVLASIRYSLARSFSLLTSLAATTLDVYNMVTWIYQEVLSRREIYRISTPYAQTPAIVEDARGWEIQLPLEVIGSWATLHSILNDKFSNHPGNTLVRQRRYLLRDALNGGVLPESIAPCALIRPGQRINMSMIFYSDSETDGFCPRCKMISLGSSNGEIRCPAPHCEMIYSRTTDIFRPEIDVSHMISVPPDEHSVGIVCRRSFMDDRVPTNCAQGEENDPGPEIFKRVQFFTRWDDRQDSRGLPLIGFADYTFWDVHGDTGKMLAWDLFQRLSSNTERILKAHIPDTSGVVLKHGHACDTDYFRVGLGFLGRRLRTSVPVVVIWSQEDIISNRVMEFVQTIEWLRNNPRFVVVATSEDQEAVDYIGDIEPLRGFIEPDRSYRVWNKC